MNDNAGCSPPSHMPPPSEESANAQVWLQKAVEGNGANVVGGYVGADVADLEIEIEGHRHIVTIRPWQK